MDVLVYQQGIVTIIVRLERSLKVFHHVKMVLPLMSLCDDSHGGLRCKDKPAKIDFESRIDVWISPPAKLFKICVLVFRKVNVFLCMENIFIAQPVSGFLVILISSGILKVILSPNLLKICRHFCPRGPRLFLYD